MGLLKPYTTLLVGMALGMFVLPKVWKMIPMGGSSA